MANMHQDFKRPPILPEEPQIAGVVLTLPMPDYLQQEQDDARKLGLMPASGRATDVDPFDGIGWESMTENFQGFLDANNGLPGR